MIKVFVLTFSFLGYATPSFAQTANCFIEYAYKNHRKQMPVVMDVEGVSTTIIFNEDNQYKRIGDLLRFADQSKLTEDVFVVFFEKVTQQLIKQTGRDISSEVVASILHDANYNLLICPIVKVKDGYEKRSVYTYKKLLQYVVQESTRRQVKD